MLGKKDDKSTVGSSKNLMVPGLSKKPLLFDLKPKSQRNINNLLTVGKLDSPDQTDKNPDLPKEATVQSKKEENDEEGSKNNENLIKLSDVIPQNDLLNIKETCK